VCKPQPAPLAPPAGMVRASATLRPSVPEWALELYRFYSRMLEGEGGDSSESSGPCLRCGMVVRPCAACGLTVCCGETAREDLVTYLASVAAGDLLLAAEARCSGLGAMPHYCGLCRGLCGTGSG
jgi:hypothetical protein